MSQLDTVNIVHKVLRFLILYFRIEKETETE